MRAAERESEPFYCHFVSALEAAGERASERELEWELEWELDRELLCAGQRFSFASSPVWLPAVILVQPFSTLPVGRARARWRCFVFEPQQQPLALSDDRWARQTIRWVHFYFPPLAKSS